MESGFFGKVDVIYGSKGAGKSAIYALIDKRQDELFDRKILVRSAENIRGNTAFSDILSDPPPSERDFIDLWKLYFLILVGSTLREYEVSTKEAKALVSSLEKAELLPIGGSLAQFFHQAKRLIWSQNSPDVDSVEWTVALDPNSGLPIVSRKSKYSTEIKSDEIKIPLDNLLYSANKALNSSEFTLWILFDRLDVAFNDNPDLEKNALRALFRMYNDFKAFDNIKIKIFVRDDIWERIISGGFSEASHITKTTTIDWSYENLANLFVRRLLSNDAVLEYLGIDGANVTEDFDRQIEIIRQIFPDKVETGNNPETFRWMTNRIQDALGKPAPRELIHLSEMIRQQQIGRIERGEEEPADMLLFDRAVFKPALRDVSRVRYEHTFKAENPSLSEYTDKLKGQKSENTLESLSIHWGIGENEAAKIIERLVKSGFFERREVRKEVTYWVTFIYRDALELIQGRSS